MGQTKMETRRDELLLPVYVLLCNGNWHIYIFSLFYIRGNKYLLYWCKIILMEVHPVKII